MIGEINELGEVNWGPVFNVENSLNYFSTNYINWLGQLITIDNNMIHFYDIDYNNLTLTKNDVNQITSDIHWGSLLSLENSKKIMIKYIDKDQLSDGTHNYSVGNFTASI